MTLDEVRRFALSLPEVTEEPHFEKSSFRVGGKIFATVPEDELHLQILLDPDESAAVAAEDPAVFGELWWGKKLSGVRAVLDPASPDVVFELLESAWRRRAPKRLLSPEPGPSPLPPSRR